MGCRTLHVFCEDVFPRVRLRVVVLGSKAHRILNIGGLRANRRRTHPYVECVSLAMHKCATHHHVRRLALLQTVRIRDGAGAAGYSHRSIDPHKINIFKTDEIAVSSQPLARPPAFPTAEPPFTPRAIVKDP